MATSVAWSKTRLIGIGALAALGCAEGPVYTLGSQPEPEDAAVDVEPDVMVDATPDAGPDAEPDAEPDAAVEPPFEFQEAELVPVLNEMGVKDENPTFTADELEVYFTRDGGDTSGDVWTARRDLLTDEFDPPTRLDAPVNTDDTETSPAISSDGNTLWVASNTGSADDNDVYEFRRGAMGLFELVEEPNPVLLLNSSEPDIPRPLGFRDTVMPLARRVPAFDNQYQTFFAPRASDGTFDMPAMVQELVQPDKNFVDAFLTDDGLMLLFQRTSDLWYSKRDSPDSPWPPAQEIPGVNTPEPGKERDPWLSRDGQRLYFARSISGDEEDFDIYMATRVPAE